MSGEKDCVVRLRDDHGVEHTVKVKAESVYEAALKGLRRLKRVGWDSDGSQVGWVVVEIWEAPTVHKVNVSKMLDWLKRPGRSPRDSSRKNQLRALIE